MPQSVPSSGYVHITAYRNWWIHREFWKHLSLSVASPTLSVCENLVCYESKGIGHELLTAVIVIVTFWESKCLLKGRRGRPKKLLGPAISHWGNGTGDKKRTEWIWKVWGMTVKSANELCTSSTTNKRLMYNGSLNQIITGRVSKCSINAASRIFRSLEYFGQALSKCSIVSGQPHRRQSGQSSRPIVWRLLGQCYSKTQPV